MARRGEFLMGEKEKETGEEVSQPVPPDPERRRLVKASLGAAPVLLTLTARPVLGQTGTPADSAGSDNS